MNKKEAIKNIMVSKLKIGIFLLFLMLMIQLGSAYEFDNIKSYNETTKEVTISNSVLGIPFLPLGEIAKVKLLTPLDYEVGAGYQKVVEFEINSLVDYPTAIKELELYNVKDGMKPINRIMDYRFKSIQEVKVDDYITECSPAKLDEKELQNGTKPYDICTEVINGSHNEMQEVWLEKPDMDIKTETITIGLFTEVEVGDKVEWIPNLFGVRVDEWAIWTSDLNVGLVSYYPMDESSGGVLDVAGGNHGTNNGATAGVTGKIGTGYSFDGSNDYIRTDGNTGISGNSARSINLWWNYSSAGGTAGRDWVSLGAEDTYSYYNEAAGGTHNEMQVGTTSLSYGSRPTGYHMYSVTYNGSNMTIYLDGVYVASTTRGAISTTNSYFWIGGYQPTGHYSKGYIDEVGLWNRSLTQAEVTQLYNGGAGISPTQIYLAPNITMITASQNFTTTASRQIQLYASDRIKVQNVTLYVNGKINQTNTTGLNNSYYYFNVTLSDGTYSILGNAKNNQSTNNTANSSTITILVDSTAASILITSNPTITTLYTNHTIQYNVNDTNLASCWLEYNSLNRTIPCTSGKINTTNFTVDRTKLTFKVWANDTSGNKNSASGTLVLETTKPTIVSNYPTALVNYGRVNGSLQLNITSTDTNLDKVWYNYNGTNITIAGATSGVGGLSNITLSTKKNVTIYANDTVGNLNYTTVSWDYKIFENSRTYNATSYETAYESYSHNVTSNATLTAVKIVYDAVEHSMTDGGTWDYSRDINTTDVGNNSIRFKYTYGAETFYSDYSYQNVLGTYLALCNATYTVRYLNITFKDEATLGSINATMPNGVFDYYLGNGTVTKQLQFINTSENTRYSFCVSPPNRILNIDPYVQYASSGYPQRIWNPTVTSYSNTTTSQVLYLLSSSDGLYVTFQVINAQDQLLSDVEITATREISGNDVVVGTGTTGADGTVTFWLNPDFAHEFSFSKTGFTTYTTTITPTQTSYTVTMSGGGGSVFYDYTKGMTLELYPTAQELFNDTSYSFAFNVTSSYWDVSSFGYKLRLSNGSIVSTATSTTESTAATSNYDVNNQSVIYMDYYWVIGGNTTRGTKYWIVTNTEYTGWSVSHFFTRLNSYMTVGFFGLDNFGRYLIIFLILVLTIGTMSYKYGLTSPIAVTTMIFLVIFFFDVVVGLIPVIRGIDNLLTYLAGLILVVLVLKETTQ